MKAGPQIFPLLLVVVLWVDVLLLLVLVELWVELVYWVLEVVT